MKIFRVLTAVSLSIALSTSAFAGGGFSLHLATAGGSGTADGQTFAKGRDPNVSSVQSVASIAVPGSASTIATSTNTATAEGHNAKAAAGGSATLTDTTNTVKSIRAH